MDLPSKRSSFECEAKDVLPFSSPRLKQKLASVLSGGIEYVTKNVGGFKELDFENNVLFFKFLDVEKSVSTLVDWSVLILLDDDFGFSCIFEVPLLGHNSAIR